MRTILRGTKKPMSKSLVSKATRNSFRTGKYWRVIYSAGIKERIGKGLSVKFEFFSSCDLRCVLSFGRSVTVFFYFLPFKNELTNETTLLLSTPQNKVLTSFFSSGVISSSLETRSIKNSAMSFCSPVFSGWWSIWYTLQKLRGL